VSWLKNIAKVPKQSHRKGKEDQRLLKNESLYIPLYIIYIYFAFVKKDVLELLILIYIYSFIYFYIYIYIYDMFYL